MKKRRKTETILWIAILILLAVLLISVFMFFPRRIERNLKGYVLDGGEGEEMSTCDISIDGKKYIHPFGENEYRGKFEISLEPRTRDAAYLTAILDENWIGGMFYIYDDPNIGMENLGWLIAADDLSWAYIHLTMEDGSFINIAAPASTQEEANEIKERALERRHPFPLPE